MKIMDLDAQIVIVGVNAREYSSNYSSKHIFVDVVFIDKSNEILCPLLYQLKSDAMRSDKDLETFRRSGYLSLSENAFAMIGEVLTIDKKKKQIQLKNQDSVTYKHLIMATGLSHTAMGSVHDQEMSAGFHTLSEALRIQKNFDQSMNTSQTISQSEHPKKSHIANSEQYEVVNIQELIKTLSSYDSSKPLNITFAGTNRRLYEVQL